MAQLSRRVLPPGTGLGATTGDTTPSFAPERSPVRPACRRCRGSRRWAGPFSHDFVEAALLRRAGWEVHLVPSLGGSYEGCPPTLKDLIVRDRRWAQGNLQHVRLLGVRGLPLLSRVHLAMGAFSYLASPIWALTLLVGIVLAVQAKYATPTYFGSEVSLFPKWPVFDAQKALTLFLVTVLVVHLPKVVGRCLGRAQWPRAPTKRRPLPASPVACRGIGPLHPDRAVADAAPNQRRRQHSAAAAMPAGAPSVASVPTMSFRLCVATRWHAPGASPGRRCAGSFRRPCSPG